MEETEQNSDLLLETVLNFKSHVTGKDPEMDYIFQFKSWKGFDCWLDSIKGKVFKKDERLILGEKYNPAQENLSPADLIGLLLDELLELKTDKQILNLPNDILVTDDELETMEYEVFQWLSDAKLKKPRMPSDVLNIGNHQADISANKLQVDDSIFSKEMRFSSKHIVPSKSNNSPIQIEVSEQKEQLKILNTAKKGKKENAKQNKEVVEEIKDTEPKSVISELLELFKEWDSIRRDNEEFLRLNQEKMYPEDSSLAVTPTHIFIKGFIQCEVYKVRFTMTNTSTNWMLITHDKLNSIYYYLFKVKGPNLVRLGPGGFCDYTIHFYSSELIDVQATIKFQIKHPDQSKTQFILPITCISCYYDLAESQEQDLIRNEE